MVAPIIDLIVIVLGAFFVIKGQVKLSRNSEIHAMAVRVVGVLALIFGVLDLLGYLSPLSNTNAFLNFTFLNIVGLVILLLLAAVFFKRNINT